MTTERPPSLRIPLDLSPAQLALAVGSRRGAAILESGPGFGDAGRWSVYACEPELTLRADGRGMWIDGRPRTTSDPLEFLAWLCRDRPSDPPLADDPPFFGGLIGYFGYDLATRFERLPRKAAADSPFADIHFGFYNRAVCYDHARGQAWLCGTDILAHDEDEARRGLVRFGKRLTREVATPKASRIGSSIACNFTKGEYLDAVGRALEYIRAGDIFQVNLSQRFEAGGKFDPLDLWLRVKQASPAPFSAFLKVKGGAVVSASPEWFYQTRGDQIITRPIKGTRPRGATPEEDARLAAELQSSAKDRAELTMIVDLERNDLGRVCRYGSVRVTEPITIETFAQVHHLVATVEGRLRPEIGPIDVVRAMFPGGSITGAPKIRAMEIIDELEPTRRGVYTGAIGYLSRSGTSAFNIAIRTMLVQDERVTYQVGGGIVADSDPESEYQETLHKGRAMRDVLEGLERMP